MPAEFEEKLNDPSSKFTSYSQVKKKATNETEKIKSLQVKIQS